MSSYLAVSRAMARGRGGRAGRTNLPQAALVAATFLVGAGCVTPPEGIKTVDGVEHDDIPVPKSFEFQGGHTPASAAEANFRSWHGYYKGTGDLGQIAPWYVAEMRKHGWEFGGMDATQDVKRLRFVKGEELAGIEIYRELDPQAASFVSIIHAEIHPRGGEEMTFEEELTFLRGGGTEASSAPKPASFSSEGEPVKAIPPGETVGARKRPPARTPRAAVTTLPHETSPRPREPAPLDPEADELEDLRQVEAIEKAAR